jgi:hypothetical protein
MLRLQVVNLLASKDDNGDASTETILPSGMNVLKQVVSPWYGFNRILSAD